MNVAYQHAPYSSEKLISLVASCEEWDNELLDFTLLSAFE